MPEKDDEFWEMAKSMTQIEIRYSLMKASRDRWRLMAIRLADDLDRRRPHLPSVDEFEKMLNDPFDGDGVNGN